jgi:polysaccharide biosynthesis protein PslH
MNILFVVPYVPNKIRVRPYNLVRFLKRRGNKVTLLTLWSNKSDLEAIQQLEAEGIRVFSYHLSRSQILINIIRGIASVDPIQSFYCWQPELAKKLVQLVCSPGSDWKFDAVHIEHMRGVRYGEYLVSQAAFTEAQKKRYIPIIWDSVDSISYLFQQAAHNGKGIISRIVIRFELPRTRTYEPKMAKLFDRTLVTSQVDKKEFEKLNPNGHNNIEVLPNGVDLTYFTPGLDQERETNTLVVSGKMSYHANVAMVTNLIHNIMPIVWRSKPDVKLWIVGKNPPKTISNLADNKKIILTGYVSDLRPYLQKATVAVSPITYGSGIQNKVLEAMACATPVVATPKAVSALFLNPGENILVEEEAPCFAEKILTLLDHPGHARQVGMAGRAYVEVFHDWNTIARQLESTYQGFIGV